MDSIVSSAPKITVLMPVYNCELYIEEAIDSILNQTYSNFELLLIDDGSTDATVGRIKQYSDSRIKLIEKPINSGLTNSLNLGIQIAKGKYIARMDGDDISVLDRFEKQVHFLENNDKVILCGGWFRIIGSNKVVKLPENDSEIKCYLLRGNCIAHPSVMLRKEALDGMEEVYDIAKEPAEDYDLWTRLAFKGELYNLPEVLLDYRTHGNQVSNRQNEVQRKIDVIIKRNYYYTLNFILFKEEESLLNSLLNHGNGIVFKDYLVFKKLQSKLLRSNTDTFFDEECFKKEIMHLDKIFVKSCFLKAKKYNPRTFFNYLKIRSTSSYRLTKKDEIKLAIKGLLFLKFKQ